MGEVNNEDISDMILQRSNGVIWIAFNGDSPAIYKDDGGTAFVSRVNEPINALGLLNDTLYVAVKSSDGTALVYRLTGTEVFEAISLSVTDTEVISLESYKSKLYLGTKGGHLYSYDESSVELLKEFDTSIEDLYSDGSLLYIMLKNSSKVIIYDGADTSEVES